MSDLVFQTIVSRDSTWDSQYDNFLNLPRAERIRICAIYGIDYEKSLKLWNENPEAAKAMVEYGI
jgi:hypothetical protein